MEQEKPQTKDRRRFNWKIVLITAIIVGTFVAVWYLVDFNPPEKDTAFCRFEKEIESPLPRHECALVKIASAHLDSIDWLKIKESNVSNFCSRYADKIKPCYGEHAYFTEYQLKDFCVEEGCKVDGKVCVAYYISYVNESDPLIESFEETMFSVKDINVTEATMMVLDCGTED